MRKIFFVGILFIVALVSTDAFAFQCAAGRDAYGSSDSCWASVKVASNETTLVSQGTVLVYDVSNAKNDATYSAFQVRVTDSSADGIFVAGVAQGRIATSEETLILVRGKGKLAVKSADAISSGSTLFVAATGDATIITSTTQNQLGYSLQNQTSSGNSRNTIDAYITIV